MLMDLHCDVLTDVMMEWDKGRGDVLRRRHVQRFKDAGMVGGVFALWNDRPKNAAARLKEGIRATCAEMNAAKDLVQIVRKKADFYEAQKAGRIAAVLGIEGMQGIGEDVDMLHELCQMGFKVAGLTWNEENQLATGTQADENRGLTQTGKDAVRLLQKLDMIVDVSHLNDKSFWDIAAISSKPIMASHSNARSLCNVTRNLTDEQIKFIGQSGGLIGINSFNEFIDPQLKNRTVQRLAQHMAHIAQLIGTKHLGFGFDFMEYFDQDLKDWVAKEEFRLTPGLAGIEDAKNLVQQLAKQGFSKVELEGICYKNFVNLLAD